MKDKKVAVVIIDYKSHLNDFEYTSIDRCFDVLRNRDIFVMLPEGISNHEYAYIASLYGTNVRYIYDNEGWFSSWAKYSHYCFRPEFYQMFSEYEYMLIYQTDCYIFEDNLDYFINLNYNYYGAPWYQFRRCGNGGFSLRKIDAFIENTTNRPDRDVLVNGKGMLVEDYIFSILEHHIENICPEDIGLEFSLDDWLKEYTPLLKKMPMGCHGWSRDEVRWYWKDKIAVKKNPFNARVLILNMSCNLDKYVEQRNLVNETFGKDIREGKYPGFEYYFFTAGNTDVIDETNRIIYTVSDDTLKGTSDKTINTLRLISRENIDYDFVIITNTSTYFNMKLLYKFFNSGYANSRRVYGGDFQYPILLAPFFRGNFMVFPKNIIDKILRNYYKHRTENDIDLFTNLLYSMEYYDELLRIFRQVNCAIELSAFNLQEKDKYFYVSLKDRGSDAYVNIDNIKYLHSLYDNFDENVDLEGLSGPVRIVSTILGHYRIEKLD